MSAPGLPPVLVLHWGRNGGGPRFHHGLVRALAAAGADLHVSWSRQVEAPERFTSLGVPGVAVDTFATPRELLRVDRWARAALALRRYVRAHRIEAVVVSMDQVWQGPALWLLPRRVQVLVTVHDAVEHPGGPTLVSAVRRFTTRAEIARADGLITLSEEVSGVVRAGVAGGRPVTTSIHPVDEPHDGVLARPGPGSEPVVGFFGRLLPYKGADLLVAAAPQIRRVVPGARIRIVGDGPAELGDVSGVEVDRGWVAEEDVEGVVRSFDLLVLPYREASQSGVLGQASALGVPVVATPVGGLVEQVRVSGGGVLSAGTGVDDLAEAVVDLLTDDARYAELSATGLRSAREELSWDRVAADYASAVGALVGRPAVTP